MPHIGAVMERSLQEPGLKDAFVRLFARSAVAAFTKRQTDIQGSISDAATAFSSWDNCMAATFCKWPVIGIMIIGGLIIFSIVWCIARCCCCGLSCCCECCYCLKCCGNCLGCCDPPRGKRHKYLDEPFVPPHHDQVYRSHEPMSLSNLPPTKAKADVPQYAVFESGDKKDADSLPAMPSWEGAGSQKVLIEEESVEMEPMKKPVHSQTNLLAQNNMSQATIPSPVSPASRSPYGPPPGQTESQGYMPAARAETDPYGTNGGYNNYDNGYGQASQDNLSQGYGNQNQGYGNQGYGMAGAGVSAAAPMGRRTPHQDYNDGYGQGRMDRGYPQSRTPRPYNDEYGRSGTPGSYNRGYRAPPNNDGYGNPSRMASPAPLNNEGYRNPSRMASPGPQPGYGYSNGPRRSPGPQAGFEYPQRSQTTTPTGHNRPYPPAPQRSYTGDSGRAMARPPPQRQYPMESPPVSPIQNNSGFDFNSGYSRPENATPPPQQQQTANGGTAYPGYRAYKPAGETQGQNNWSGL